MRQGIVRPVWIVTAAVAVLLWRAVSWHHPTSFIDIPEIVRLPITLLGLIFLVCGVVAAWWRPDRFTAVFFALAVGGAIHWGGGIGAPQRGVDLALLFVYAAMSGLSEAALLHLAWIYPFTERPDRLGLIGYAAPVVALALAPFAGLLPATALTMILAYLFVFFTVLSLVAAIVLVIKLFRIDPEQRRASRLPLIVAGLLIGGVLSLLGDAGLLPGEPQAWNLTLALMPICLAVALITRR